ncbi:MAG: chemotaxis protein CheX [Syntrophobacteraceae bacterium]
MEPRLAMVKAISDVLETMFFVSVDFADWHPPAHARYYDSRIKLYDQMQIIDVRFRLEADFVKMAAANFLGLDEEQVQAEDIADVMRELANIVGGDFLGRLKRDRLQLGIPSFEPFEGDMDGMPSKVELSFMGDFAGVVIWETREGNGQGA